MKGDLEIVINSFRRGDVFHSAIGRLVKDTMSHVNPLRSFCFYHTYLQPYNG